MGVDFLEGVTGVRIFQASGSSTTPEVFGGFVVPLFRCETCFFFVHCAAAPLFPGMEGGRSDTRERNQSALLLVAFKTLSISRRCLVWRLLLFNITCSSNGRSIGCSRSLAKITRSVPFN